MQGFIYMDHFKSFGAGRNVLEGLLKAGKMVGNYEFSEGLEKGPEALQRLL